MASGDMGTILLIGAAIFGIWYISENPDVLGTDTTDTGTGYVDPGYTTYPSTTQTCPDGSVIDSTATCPAATTENTKRNAECQNWKQSNEENECGVECGVSGNEKDCEACESDCAQTYKHFYDDKPKTETKPAKTTTAKRPAEDIGRYFGKTDPVKYVPAGQFKYRVNYADAYLGSAFNRQGPSYSYRDQWDPRIRGMRIPHPARDLIGGYDLNIRKQQAFFGITVA